MAKAVETISLKELQKLKSRLAKTGPDSLAYQLAEDYGLDPNDISNVEFVVNGNDMMTVVFTAWPTGLANELLYRQAEEEDD